MSNGIWTTLSDANRKLGTSFEFFESLKNYYPTEFTATADRSAFRRQPHLH